MPTITVTRLYANKYYYDPTASNIGGSAVSGGGGGGGGGLVWNGTTVNGVGTYVDSSTIQSEPELQWDSLTGILSINPGGTTGGRVDVTQANAGDGIRFQETTGNTGHLRMDSNRLYISNGAYIGYDQRNTGELYLRYAGAQRLIVDSAGIEVTGTVEVSSLTGTGDRFVGSDATGILKNVDGPTLLEGETLTLEQVNIGDATANLTQDSAGNLVLTDSISGSQTLADLLAGSTGYWDRTGTDLSPVNSGDDVALSNSESLKWLGDGSYGIEFRGSVADYLYLENDGTESMLWAPTFISSFRNFVPNNSALNLNLGSSGSWWDGVYGTTVYFDATDTNITRDGSGNMTLTDAVAGTYTLSQLAASAGTVTSVAAGDGMDFTTITGSGSVTMGTPSTLTPSTTNALTTTSHTHAITGFAEISGTPTTNDLAIWVSSTEIADTNGDVTLSGGTLTASNFESNGTITAASLTSGGNTLVGATSAGLLYTTLSPEIDDITLDYIDFNPITAPAHLEGRLYYDSTRHALTFYNEEADVAVNLGSETVGRIYNDTGQTITNGQVLSTEGDIETGLFKVVLADARRKNRSRFVAVATHDIEDQTFGYATFFGAVRDVDTSGFTAGDLLYVSDTTPGAFTATRPSDGAWAIELGYVMVADAVNGVVGVDPKIPELTVEVTDTNGFTSAQRLTTEMSFDDGTRTFTIGPTSASDGEFHFYEEGNKYEKTTDQTVVITDVEGLHAIYFDAGVLTATANPTTTEIDVLIRTKCLVAYVYWDATNSEHIYLADERHGIHMATDTHAYLHFTRGAQYLTGLALDDFDIDPVGAPGDGNANGQFSVTAGLITDEDLPTIISAVSSTTGLPVYYLEGANGDLRRAYQPGFSVLLDSDHGGTVDRLQYNEFTGGVWQASPIGSDNDFVLCHVFATNNVSEPLIAVMGQAEYTNRSQARQGANNEIANLVFVLGLEESVPIATVIFQTNDNWSASDAYCKVVTTEDGENYIPWTTTELAQGTNPTDHGNLSGLADDDHTQYALLLGRAGDILRIETISNTNSIIFSGGGVITGSVSGEITIAPGVEFNVNSPVNFTGLASDDTEDHFVAIDDTTGLLTKRSVASLPTGPTIGTATYVPYVNGTGDDFDYNASFYYATGILHVPDIQVSAIAATTTPQFVTAAVATGELESHEELTWDGSVFTVDGEVNVTRLSFDDGDSYIQEVAEDQIGIYAGGTTTVIINSTNMRGSGGNNFNINTSLDTSTSLPVYSFRSDLDTGVGTSAADTLSLFAGGIEVLSINALGATVDGAMQIGNANVYLENSGDELELTDDTGTYTLSQLASGGLTVGGTGQIPYVDGTGNDFSYSSSLTYTTGVLIAPDVRISSSAGGSTRIATIDSSGNVDTGNLTGQVTTSGLTASLAVSAITDQTAVTSGLADTDELLLNDGGSLARVDLSVLKDYMQKEYASFYLGTGGVTGVAATATTLTVNNTSRNSNTSVFTLSSSQITVNKTGDFEISYQVYFNSGGSSRSEYTVWLEQDSTEVAGSRTGTYQRGYDSGDTAAGSIIVSVTSGDVFRLRIQRTDGTATTGYQDDNGTRISFKEM